MNWSVQVELCSLVNSAATPQGIAPSTKVLLQSTARIERTALEF